MWTKNLHMIHAESGSSEQRANRSSSFEVARNFLRADVHFSLPVDSTLAGDTRLRLVFCARLEEVVERSRKA